MTLKTCTRRTVVAVLYDSEGCEKAIGTNGINNSRGSCLEGDCPRGLLTYEELPPDSPYAADLGECRSPHAEIRALILGGQYVRGGHLVVSEEPCHQCKVVIEDSELALCTWPTGSWRSGELFDL